MTDKLKRVVILGSASGEEQKKELMRSWEQRRIDLEKLLAEEEALLQSEEVPPDVLRTLDIGRQAAIRLRKGRREAGVERLKQEIKGLSDALTKLEKSDARSQS